MPRSRIEERRRRLRLDLLEVPWDPEGREIVRAEMDSLEMTLDILFVELRAAGWNQSYSTLGRWLRGQSEPSATELGLLTGVLAGYSANWPKARNLSSPQEAYSFWPTPRADEDLRLPIPA
jgi:hypothetical protein